MITANGCFYAEPYFHEERIVGARPYYAGDRYFLGYKKPEGKKPPKLIFWTKMASLDPRSENSVDGGYGSSGLVYFVYSYCATLPLNTFYYAKAFNGAQGTCVDAGIETMTAARARCQAFEDKFNRENP